MTAPLSSEHIDMVLMGNSSVGKTCLSTRFSENRFSPLTTSTIGAAFVRNRFNVRCSSRSVPCTIKLSDTAGTETYSSLSSFYCRKAHCALLCFDLTSKKSLLELDKWIELTENSAVQYFVLVGCKRDVLEAFEACDTEADRSRLLNSAQYSSLKLNPDEFVTESLIEEQLNAIRLHQQELQRNIIGSFVTSSKTGQGVMEMFEKAAQVIVSDRLQRPHMSPSSPSNRVDVHLFSREVTQESRPRKRWWCW
mmetsp:Transcript_6817/g.25451  ORF Transcript_6817/g.25451 Transcript_6817/m.25451 type:complete len:251 (-) Transcript_6817:84-836(-)